MKFKFYYSLITIAGILFLISSAFMIPENEGGDKTNKDVVKFSHQFHMEITDCETCHDDILESESLEGANLPMMSDCGDCHDVDDDENCTQCHYEDEYPTWEDDEEELYFNHQAHMEQYDMECSTCHSGLSDVDYSADAPGAFPPMLTCSECHSPVEVATNECAACHVETAGLIPQDHKQANFPENHQFTAKTEEAECGICHDVTFCETCHAATNGLTATDGLLDDLMAPLAPHNFVDNAKQQKLTRVHDLNYRMTHGIDARGQVTQCKTCHEVETFCAECHDSESGNFGGVTPATHFDQGFVTIGVGSGGGQHAELARRNIESCAACHDTYGADPNCILCHVDADGIEGTNPKTHKNGFLSDIEGDWHHDAGAICYNCHTDVNARPDGTPGMGFCGYCHQ